MTPENRIDRRHGHNVFVGRGRELAELHAGLDEIVLGRGRLILLSGEPGIGKTRLAERFCEAAAIRGVRIAWGRCWEGDGAPAYWPWIQVLRACLGETQTEQRNAILASEATPQIAQDIAQLLPELRTALLPTVKHPGSQPSDPERARFQLFESVATLLCNVARIAPLVIVVDDLHDADHPSLLMQRFIARQTKGAPILMVGAYRDTEVRQSQELSKLIGDLNREGYLIPIGGLSQAEVGEFVESRSGQKADDHVVADLYHATDGNPLFVDGVVRLLVTERKIHKAGLDGDGFRIPDGVRESIRRRLDRLPETTTLMLSIASVIGNEFEKRILAQVSGSAAEQVTERMEDAIRAGILIGGANANLGYRFSHALIREVLYKDLTTRRRGDLHSQIGMVSEEVHKSDLKPHLASLAHHFREGGITDKAIDYSILAGEAAEAVFAYDDALSHLRPGLALAETSNSNGSRHAHILLRLGYIEATFENVLHGIAHLEAALKIYEQIGEDEHTGEIHSHLGRLLGPTSPLMNPPRALAHLERAKVLMGQSNDKHVLAMLYWGLALANLTAMRTDEAMAASQNAMSLLAQIGERELWARIAGSHSSYLMIKGKLAQAVALLGEIKRAATDFVDPDAFRNVALMCGWFRLLMRDPVEASRLFQTGLSRPGPQLILTALLIESLTLAELLAGNLAEAKGFAAENRVKLTFRSQIAYYEGEWKVAGEMLRQYLDWAQTVGAKWEELHTLAYLVELLRVIGDYGGAAAALERALSLYPPDDYQSEIRIRPQAAILCIDSGRPEKAEEHLEYCRKIFAQEEDWLGRAAAVWRAEAMVAAAQSRFRESANFFEKSLEICGKYSLPWEAAETLHYWGRALLGAGRLPGAHEKLDAAIKIYRDHGAGHCWIDRVEADQHRMQQPRSHSGPVSTEGADGEAVLRNEGDFWTIAYRGRTSRLRDGKGLHHLAHLLAHPCEEIRALELATRSGGADAEVVDISRTVGVAQTGALTGDLGHAGEMLDAQAKAAYKRRLTALRDELTDAREIGNEELTAKAEGEIEALERELRRAIGRGGRDRRAASNAERARVAVRRSIRLALDRISAQNGDLGRLLFATIKTGGVCSYIPDDNYPVRWRL